VLIKNVRRSPISLIRGSGPVPCQVPQMTAPYFFESYLQMSSLRRATPFLVEWDLDSGSAARVVGIAKRVRTYPTESSEMPRPCFWGARHTQLTIAYRCICINGFFSLRVSLFLANGLFKTPHMVSLESRSKSPPLRCALVTQCIVLSSSGARFYII